MDWKERLFKCMDERTYNRLCYYYLHLRHKRIPKILNIRHPTTFNEKTIWLKMFQRYENAHILVDKVLVKEFVKQTIGEKYLIPTIAVFDSASEIELDKLPAAFVIKPNHGSGWSVICEDKSKCDFDGMVKKLDEWLKTDYSAIGKEYQYARIEPKLLCEMYLESSPENPLIDYKVFCFSGVPQFIQVDLDRFTNHTRNFYDLEWNVQPFTTLYPLGTRILARPQGLDEMLSIAERLSAGMAFARIDLYFHDSSIYFGEITLHHGGGFEPFIPSEYDRILGDCLSL